MDSWQSAETLPRDGTWVRIRGKWTPQEGVLVSWTGEPFTGCNAGGRRPIPLVTDGEKGFWRTPEGWAWAHEAHTLFGWRRYGGDALAGYREIAGA